MIIIPDVHGRSFWKEAVKEARPNESVVFLGDYLDHYKGEKDPYRQSYIDDNDSVVNFKEIVEYAKENKNVTLLLGNHDTEYFLGTPESRIYVWAMKQIRSVFENNRDLFKLAFYKEFNGKVYTFSHSCITRGWVAFNKNVFGNFDGITDVIDKLGKLSDEKLSKILSQVGYSRWGMNEYGSMVWADMSDMDERDWEDDKKPVFQIFGHTQQRMYPVFTRNFAMLDCRQAFRLDEETGNITCLTNDEEKFSRVYAKEEK